MATPSQRGCVRVCLRILAYCKIQMPHKLVAFLYRYEA